MNRFTLVNARSVAEAAQSSSAVAELMRHADRSPGVATVLKAGGIDLLDLMKENLLTPDRVVNLGGIPDLDRISVTDAGLKIGAMATLATLAGHPLVLARARILAQAAAASASPQIRNMATLGGNILQRPRCWYFRAKEFRCLRKGGDHCYALDGQSQYHAVFDNNICAIVHPSTVATVLAALNARVELVDAHGEVRKVSLADFLLSPGQDLTRETDIRDGEILLAVEIPPCPATSRCAWLKQGERASSDWPLADVAVCLDFDNQQICRTATIVLGAAAPTPHRARSAEARLVGRVVDASVASEAGRAALDGATPLAGNAYKIPLLETLVRRAVLQAASGAA